MVRHGPGAEEDGATGGARRGGVVRTAELGRMSTPPGNTSSTQKPSGCCEPRVSHEDHGCREPGRVQAPDEAGPGEEVGW